MMACPENVRHMKQCRMVVHERIPTYACMAEARFAWFFVSHHSMCPGVYKRGESHADKQWRMDLTLGAAHTCGTPMFERRAGE